jgi:excisionase family DNA binding protein
MAETIDGVGDGGLLTVAEAVAFLRIGRTTLYGMLSRGDLPSARIGRARRIPRRAVIELANRALVKPGEGRP